MATARSDVSIPHARLEGGWNVLSRSEDGRPTIAVRDDERSGVAIAYPFADAGTEADPIDRIAVVVNVSQEYVLLAASFDSLDAVDWLLADRDLSVTVLPRAQYDSLSSGEVCDRLGDDTVVVVDPSDDGRHGVLQLFGDVDPVRSTWLHRIPALDDRLFSVGRVLGDVDLRELSRRVRADVEPRPT